MFFPFCKKKNKINPHLLFFQSHAEMRINSSYLCRLPRAFPASCFSPSLVVGAAFSIPGSISKNSGFVEKKNITLLGYNKRKRRINEHIVSKIAIEIKLLWSALGEGDAPNVLEEEEEDEEENGEREWRRGGGGRQPFSANGLLPQSPNNSQVSPLLPCALLIQAGPF